MILITFMLGCCIELLLVSLAAMYMVKHCASDVQKCSMRGGVEWQIHHDAKLSAVFDMRPHPKYCTLLINGALIDLLFCVGRISSSNGSIA